MTNIVQPYIEDYLEMIFPTEDEYLEKLREIAVEDGVPIVDRQVGEFLKMLILMEKPKKILELGTAIGYSSSLMAKTLKSVEIDTVEINSNMAIMARTNLHNQNLEDRVKLHVQDALDFLKETKETFDLIFIDAAKGQYEEYFKYSLKCLSSQGLIIMDNVLFHGMVARPGIVDRRKITIIKRLRKFLPNILSSKKFDTSLLPIGDGLLLIRRTNEES